VIFDLNRKKAAYEKFGVPSYWVVDPDPAAPELTVFELRDGHYFLAATSTRPLTMAHPFDITVVPANLTKGLPR
jgi:Uma2 family endonuclease